MLWFAYDGTIHGDWVSHYAIRLALHLGQERIPIIHIDDGAAHGDLEERLHLLEDRCRVVALEPEVLRRPAGRPVAQQLADLVPPGRDSYLVCGTRGRQGKRGFLTGTVPENLLRAGLWQVLAVRVVNPGVLGQPRRVLMPLPAVRPDPGAELPFLRPLTPELKALHLLTVAEVPRRTFRNLPHGESQRLMRHGAETLRQQEQALRVGLDLSAVKVETRVVVSDDVTKEILIAANQFSAQLIYLAASPRNLTQRFFYGNPMEQLLRQAPCDVAIYKGLP